jgi:hypothetical protein
MKRLLDVLKATWGCVRFAVLTLACAAAGAWVLMILWQLWLMATGKW